MDPETEREALARLDDDGRPDVWLQRASGWLAIMTPTGRVNPKSRTLHRSGLYALRVRGAIHHTEAAQAADLRPGRPVDLVREPANPYDANAIALHAPGAADPFGYVNKQNAARIAPRMDAGTQFAAVVLTGEGPGVLTGAATYVLIADVELMARLKQKR